MRNKLKKAILSLSSATMLLIAFVLIIDDLCQYKTILISVFLSCVLALLTKKAWHYCTQVKTEKSVEKTTDDPKKYISFIDNISEGFIATTAKGQVIYANKNFCDMTGYKQKDIKGEHFDKITSCQIQNLTGTTECYLNSKTEKLIPVLISAIGITNKQLAKSGERAFCITDLREIRSIEKQLQQEKKLNQALFEDFHFPLLIVDKGTGLITHANRKACELTGYDEQELIFKKQEEIIPEKNNTKNQSDPKASRYLLEEEVVRKDGSFVTVIRGSSTVTLKGSKKILETIIDITERKKAEEKMLKAQRLESIATLASGVAHEFNNINSIMQGTIDLIFVSDDEETPNHIKESLTTIKKMIERGAHIINDLMVFTSDRAEDFTDFSLLDLVEECIYEIKNNIEDYDVSIITKIDQNTKVYANRDEIKSVFSNLLSNALHSLVERRVRQIVIKAQEDEKIVNISIEDTGCGIKRENMEKIFDPFFSTKGIYAKSGSNQSKFESKGLGLSVCHTILEKHHNTQLYIKSKENKGTRARFSLVKRQA
jgi:PAS domain S-box-containing protein